MATISKLRENVQKKKKPHLEKRFLFMGASNISERRGNSRKARVLISQVSEVGPGGWEVTCMGRDWRKARKKARPVNYAGRWLKISR